MVRRTRKPQRRRRNYSSSPLYRHRTRVRWLQAQRIRVRFYLRRFGKPDDDPEPAGSTD